MATECPGPRPRARPSDWTVRSPTSDWADCRRPYQAGWQRPSAAEWNDMPNDVASPHGNDPPLPPYAPAPDQGEAIGLDDPFPTSDWADCRRPYQAGWQHPSTAEWNDMADDVASPHGNDPAVATVCPGPRPGARPSD
ncbi:MAG: hypothetical protein H6633_27050 [Anaerolineales bacterium]|nr:hypothetical protein [Anaerolineales bacterium]